MKFFLFKEKYFLFYKFFMFPFINFFEDFTSFIMAVFIPQKFIQTVNVLGILLSVFLNNKLMDFFQII